MTQVEVLVSENIMIKKPVKDGAPEASEGIESQLLEIFDIMGIKYRLEYREDSSLMARLYVQGERK